MTHATPTLPKASPPPQKRRRDPKGTRERLVRAALDLFATNGYHASTTPQIAGRAGVAEGTIYRHFASKEQLLNEIYRGAVKLFTGFITELPREATCQQRMAAIAEGWRRVAQKDPGLVILVFVAPPTTVLDANSAARYREMRAEVERVLASGKAAGDVRAGPVDVWADVWLQLVTLMLQRLANNEWDADHTAPNQVIQSAWDAIAARFTALPPA